MFCRECGTKIKDTAKFCPKCGKQVGSTTAPVQPVVKAAAPVQPAVEVKPVEPIKPVEEIKPVGRFCRDCGTQLKDTAKFCPKCGKQVGSAAVPVQPVVEEVKAEVPVKPVVEEVKAEVPVQPIVEEVKEEVPAQPVVEEVKVVAPAQPIVEEVKEEVPAQPVVEEVKEAAPVQPVVEEVKVASPVQQASKKGKGGLIIGVIVLLVLAVAIVVGIYLLRGGEGQGETQTSTETEVAQSEDATAQSAEADQTNETAENISSTLYAMLDNKEYENVIAKILETDMSTVAAEEAYMINAMLQEAVEGQLTLALEEIDTLVAAGSYEEAFRALADEEAYRNGLADKATVDNQALTDKFEEIKQGYSEYVQKEADSYAVQADEAGIVEVLSNAKERLDADVYKRISEKAYTNLVLSRLAQLYHAADQTYEEGYDAGAVLTYIENYQDRCGRNCLILENWDFFYVLYRIENGVANWDITVKNVSSDGYILPNSASQELTKADISHLSRHELYLARMEIYARHGRQFMDATVQGHFAQYSWYPADVPSATFDEASLSEIEKKNRDLIYDYEVELGYRNCR